MVFVCVCCRSAQAYENKHTIRVDETLVALAFCARQDQSEKLRCLSNATALTLLSNQYDFFLYVKYCTDVTKTLHGAARKGWGRGMRQFVRKWYERWSPTQLADMYGEHRGLYRWTHRDV